MREKVFKGLQSRFLENMEMWWTLLQVVHLLIITPKANW